MSHEKMFWNWQCAACQPPRVVGAGTYNFRRRHLQLLKVVGASIRRLLGSQLGRLQVRVYYGSQLGRYKSGSSVEASSGVTTCQHLQLLGFVGAGTYQKSQHLHFAEAWEKVGGTIFFRKGSPRGEIVCR